MVNPWSQKLSEAQKRDEIKNRTKKFVDHSTDESIDEEFAVQIVQRPGVKSSQRYKPPHAQRHEEDVHESQELRRQAST